jgi:large subunit ribosomal protein L25
MAETRLAAEAGRPTGSRPSRRLRHTGRIPAVIYGHGMEPMAISVGARDLRAALSAHGANQVLTLEIGKTTHMVLARQLQRHPVRRTVSHVDFQVVRRDEVVTAEVPVVMTGTATAVEREGGVVEHLLSSLTVHATPEHIPERIMVDVSALQLGDAIRIRDLELPSGVTTELSPDETVIIGAAGKLTAEMEAEEAAAAEAGGEAETPTGRAGEGSGEG